MANELQERYGDLLLDHIRADRYPSVTHTNMLEQIATPQVRSSTRCTFSIGSRPTNTRASR